MYKYIFIFCCMASGFNAVAQAPCSTPLYRQFDFWLGEWEAFAKNGSKAGDSKVTLMLDSCSLLEEWTSATVQNGVRYAGKSFNTYNAATNNWQQTWVDNAGSTNEYLKGTFSNNQLTFTSEPFPFRNDTIAIRKMTFTNLSLNKLRQHGEISKDNGDTWQTEYDLEYRRKNNNSNAAINDILHRMEKDYDNGNYKKIAAYYSTHGKIIGRGTRVSGTTALEKYWERFSGMGGNWKLTSNNIETINGQIWQNGTSIITDKKGQIHKVDFTLLWAMEQGEWKILMDAYWPAEG